MYRFTWQTLIWLSRNSGSKKWRLQLLNWYVVIKRFNTVMQTQIPKRQCWQGVYYMLSFCISLVLKNQKGCNCRCSASIAEAWSSSCSRVCTINWRSRQHLHGNTIMLNIRETVHKVPIFPASCFRWNKTSVLRRTQHANVKIVEYGRVVVVKISFECTTWLRPQLTHKPVVLTRRARNWALWELGSKLIRIKHSGANLNLFQLILDA